jgi:hypothetical protein
VTCSSEDRTHVQSRAGYTAVYPAFIPRASIKVVPCCPKEPENYLLCVNEIFAWHTEIHSGHRLSCAFCGPHVYEYGVWNLRDSIAVPLSF